MAGEKYLTKLSAFATAYHKDKVRNISTARNISMSRLVLFAIDNELLKDRPFDFDVTIPPSDHERYTFADESGKIINFLRTLHIGAALDILLLLRFKIGIPDKETFLLAFRECLDTKMIEEFKPKHRGDGPPPPDDYYYYRVVGWELPKKKKPKPRESELDKYLRLQAKLKKAGKLT